MELERFSPLATTGEEDPRATGNCGRWWVGCPSFQGKARVASGLSQDLNEKGELTPVGPQLSPLFKGWESLRLNLMVHPAPQPTEGRLSDRSLHVCVCSYLAILATLGWACDKQ